MYSLDKAKMITAHIGQIFEVNLDLQSKDADCTWSLSFMPQCINLLDVSVYSSPSAIYRRERKQVFSFLALGKSKSSLEFNLLRVLTPIVIVKEQSIPIVIAKKEMLLEEELKQVMGNDRFIKTAHESQLATSGNHKVYGAPMDYFGYHSQKAEHVDPRRKITSSASSRHYFYSS
ncbi:MAG: hypothetical protein OEM02_12470 [Desulfobulbaceae bacterium]|nr:hypothetical protein [Desulfobulbaceae bacterium]